MSRPAHKAMRSASHWLAVAALVLATWGAAHTASHESARPGEGCAICSAASVATPAPAASQASPPVVPDVRLPSLAPRTWTPVFLPAGAARAPPVL